MHRFFISNDLTGCDRVALPAEVARQLFRVLRLRPGARIVLFCGDGEECEAVLEEVGSDRAAACILNRRRPEVELRCRLHVAVAALKGEKPEWVVQKLTELGAARVTFLETERTVVSAGEERWPKRLERFARIAREAAEQCGRVRLPEMCGPVRLPRLLEEESGSLCLFLEPRAPEALAARLQPCPEQVLLLIGPEGGFTPGEMRAAEESGAVPVRLGRRILRAETAALAAAAIVAATVEGEAAG